MALPEKWQFLLSDDESKEMLQQWLKKEYGLDDYKPQSHHNSFDFPNRSTKDGFKQGYHYNSSAETGYKEISKEQFRQFVLKQDIDTYQIF